jgi:hypothetical protein
MRASVADQNALLRELKAAQVRVIRCGISHDDKRCCQQFSSHSRKLFQHPPVFSTVIWKQA